MSIDKIEATLKEQSAIVARLRQIENFRDDLRCGKADLQSSWQFELKDVLSPERLSRALSAIELELHAEASALVAALSEQGLDVSQVTIASPEPIKGT